MSLKDLSTLAPIDILVWIIIHCEGKYYLYMQNVLCIVGLITASLASIQAIAPSPQLWQRKMSPDIALSPLRGKSSFMDILYRQRLCFIDRNFWPKVPCWKYDKCQRKLWINEWISSLKSAFFNLRNCPSVCVSLAFAFCCAYIFSPSYIVWFPYFLSTYRMSGV